MRFIIDKYRLSDLIRRLSPEEFRTVILFSILGYEYQTAFGRYMDNLKAKYGIDCVVPSANGVAKEDIPLLIAQMIILGLKICSEQY